VRAAPAEDLDVERTSAPPLSGVAIAASAVATIASIGLAIDGSSAWSMIGVAGAIVIPTLAVRRMWSAGSRTAGWWARRIRGRFGDLLFGVASIGVRRRAEPIPVAGEPTVVALRDAVIELYDALGAEQRAAFPQLPALATRLGRDAVEPTDRVFASSTDQRTEVVALEMLRLELLRMHAVAGEPVGLTREISDAMRLGDRIAEQGREPVAERTPP
jgi:hypothetical protein